MARDIKSTADKIKEIVDMNSPGYLTDEPYQVYKGLVESGAADRKTAAAILHFLAVGLLSEAENGGDADLLSEVIRKECSLNKKMADRVAVIMLALYSNDNKQDWQNKNLEGLSQFMSEEFVCIWKGSAVWDAGNGTVDCWYEAEIILTPTKSVSEDKELEQLLRKKPFTKKEVIHDLFAKRLCKYLNYEFEEYCTEDDYYQPVVEDFGNNVSYCLEKWCKENGFEYVSFEGDGEDGGYEPKYRKGWY